MHYGFVDDATFDAMIAAGELLEWAVVHRAARYGTPRQPVEEALARGDLALLEIDLQGARQVRETMPEALFVFLKPPSWEELVRRLVGRGTERGVSERAGWRRLSRNWRLSGSSTSPWSTATFGSGRRIGTLDAHVRALG